MDEDQYDVALERLKNTFGNPKQLERHYRAVIKELTLQNLSNAAAVGELRKFHDNLSNAKGALAANGLEMAMYSEIEAPDFLAALPQNLTDRWIRDKWPADHTPTIEEILQQLDMEILIKERQVNNRSRSTPQRERNIITSTPRILTCLFCRQNHVAHSCTVGPVQTRLNEVNSSKRCQKCFGKSHLTTECLARFPCRICGSQNHSPALCMGKQPNRVNQNQRQDRYVSPQRHFTPQTTGQSPRNQSQRPERRVEFDTHVNTN